MPPAGRSSPASRCSSEVLPEPAGPTTAVSSPAGASSDTSRSTSTRVRASPTRWKRLCAMTPGMAGTLPPRAEPQRSVSRTFGGGPARAITASDRPRISRMISSVPPPIGPRRASRTRALELGVGADQAQALVLELEVRALGGELGHRHLAHGVAAVEVAAQRVVGERACRPAARVASSATRWRVAWPRPGQLGDRRARACARMAPTAPSAITSRSHWKLAMISLKPRSSSPSRCSRGTNTSSKASSAVSDARQPSLLERARRARPRRARCTRNDRPSVAGAAGPHRGHVEVGAHAVGDVGLGARDEPAAVDRLGARARAPPTSEPASGSVMASAPISSPRTAGSSQRALLLGGAEAEDRRRARCGCARRCPAATPPEPQRASSSASTASATQSPPYLSPSQPRSASAPNTSFGNQPASSHAVGVRPQLLQHELARAGAERLVRLRERRLDQRP